MIGLERLVCEEQVSNSRPDLGSGGKPWGFKSLDAHHFENTM